MKTEKISFKNIKDVLSRNEMKTIMAGSGGNCGTCYVSALKYACASDLLYITCVCPEQNGTSCSA